MRIFLLILFVVACNTNILTRNGEILVNKDWICQLAPINNNMNNELDNYQIDTTYFEFDKFTAQVETPFDEKFPNDEDCRLSGCESSEKLLDYIVITTSLDTLRYEMIGECSNE